MYYEFQADFTLRRNTFMLGLRELKNTKFLVD